MTNNYTTVGPKQVGQQRSIPKSTFWDINKKGKQEGRQKEEGNRRITELRQGGHNDQQQRRQEGQQEARQDRRQSETEGREGGHNDKQEGRQEESSDTNGGHILRKN